ncbi:MAG TPA: glycosyltransferase, partial [Acidimicrobiales bacterium]|nr:glycosyltransferase [Acidimicrobiales bacterium]
MLRLSLEVLRLGIGFVLLCRLPRPERARGGPLDLAVIVPARNEAGTLPGLLASLAAQTESAAEVVVVDDGSTDATAAVIQRAGVRLLPAPPRPEGWNGKQWACHVGLEATT